MTPVEATSRRGCTRAAAIAGFALLLTGTAACARPAATTTTTPTRSICADPGECPGNDPQANIRANNAYRDYKTLGPDAPDLTKSLVPRVRQTLADIRRTPPVTEESVQTALHAALPGLSTTASSSAARIPEGIGYAVTVVSGNDVQCIHGWVSARADDLEVTGPTSGEGCLPLLGH